MYKIIANESLIIAQHESHYLFECPQGEKLASDRLIFLIKDEYVEFAEFDEVLKIPEHRIVILNVPDDLKIKLMKREKRWGFMPILSNVKPWTPDMSASTKRSALTIEQTFVTKAFAVKTITASQLAAIFEVYQESLTLLNKMFIV